jgi:hypothetical protein
MGLNPPFLSTPGVGSVNDQLVLNSKVLDIGNVESVGILFIPT